MEGSAAEYDGEGSVTGRYRAASCQTNAAPIAGGAHCGGGRAWRPGETSTRRRARGAEKKKTVRRARNVLTAWRWADIT